MLKLRTSKERSLRIRHQQENLAAAREAAALPPLQLPPLRGSAGTPGEPLTLIASIAGNTNKIYLILPSHGNKEAVSKYWPGQLPERAAPRAGPVPGAAPPRQPRHQPDPPRRQGAAHSHRLPARLLHHEGDSAASRYYCF